MTQTQEMIASHPDVKGNTNDPLIACIEACFACAQACVSCADACLAEDMVRDLRQCIRFNEDCADLGLAAGRLAIRRTGSNEDTIMAALEACSLACELCAAECEKHADRHEHCRICAESCRTCEDACNQAVDSMQ